MGATASSSREVLLLGLDGAGKSTFLFSNFFTTQPGLLSETQGYNYEQVTTAKCTFSIWDIGGSQKVREMWHYFYQNIECCGFIYVINVMESQIGRIHEAKKWLHILLNEAHLFNTVAMVIFNKGEEELVVSQEYLESILDVDKTIHQVSYFMGDVGMKATVEYYMNWMGNHILAREKKIKRDKEEKEIREKMEETRRNETTNGVDDDQADNLLTGDKDKDKDKD